MDHFPDALHPRQEHPARERGGRGIDVGEGGRKGWPEYAILSKNSRIPQGEFGFHLFVFTWFFVEPAVGIEPTTC